METRKANILIIILSFICAIEGGYILNLSIQVDKLKLENSEHKGRDQVFRELAQKEKHTSDSLKTLIHAQDSIISVKEKYLPQIIKQREKAISDVTVLNANEAIKFFATHTASDTL